MKEIELKNLRKEREKHFLQEDGTIVAKVYNDDIHFKKDGEYQEIDNTLVKEKEYYINKNNDYKVYFKNTSDTELMEIQEGEHYLNINLLDSNNVPVKKQENISKLTSSIKYENILNGIDLEYKVLPTKVKENIIINNKESVVDKLNFIVDTDLSLIKNNNGSISALYENKTIFNIETPYMIDSNNNTNTNLYYQIIEDNNKYKLELILDKEWLNNALYPVVIDPTITNQGQNNSVYDTYIYSGDTNVDRNSQDILKAGVERINGKDTINRSLIKFDLPTIGTGSQVIYAEISLAGYGVDCTIDSAPLSESDIVNIHRVIKEWTETGANWASMNDKFDKRIEASFDSIRSEMYKTGAHEFSLIPSYTSANITSLVKKWYSGTPNYGILLKENKEIYRNDIIPAFYSKNNTISSSNLQPVLIITYRNQNGLENYMDYKTQSFDNGCAYVNSYNGNLTTEFDIGSTIGGNFTAPLSLVYNTNDVILQKNNGFGIGYKLSFQQTIKEIKIEDVDYLEYIDSDGTIHYFIKIDNIFEDEDGLGMTIEVNTTGYILKDKNGNKIEFLKNNGVGYLSQIVDVSDNKITVTYNSNNQIIKITDSNNSEINLTYESNKVTVISPNRTVYINFNNNKIVNINSLTGVTTFNYNEKNIISSIIDENGKKISYEYYNESPYRVKKVSEHGIENTLGAFFNIEYNFNSTTITDNKNRIVTMTFNNNGNLVSTITSKSKNDIKSAYGKTNNYGQEITTSEGTDTQYKNKLLSVDIPNKYVKNYLTNTSFENVTIAFLIPASVNSIITDEEAEFGLKSWKLTNTIINRYITKDVIVPGDKYYTFSAYIKNTNKIRISLSYLDVNDNVVESISDTINTNDNFTRYDVTINYPANAHSNLVITILLEEIGITYVDGIQLEEGEVANNYNMLENSDFSNGLGDWDLSAEDNETYESVSTDSVFEVVNINENGDKALKVKMDPSQSSSFSKKFYVNGKGGDTYNISFWYKNEAFPTTSLEGDTIYNDVMIYYNYLDQEQGHGLFGLTFNPNDNEWQYFSQSFTAEKDFDFLMLNFYQGRNANNFYITNLYLFKDVRSINYDYDENGNIVFSSGLENDASSFNYNENNHLTKMTNPKGQNFMFEYDNLTGDRVLNGISGSGICNTVKYDEFGNIILAKISKKQNTNLNDDLYKIRCKGTELYLRNINNSLKLEKDECNHDVWKIEKQGEYYKIYHSILENKYLTLKDNKLIFSNYDNDHSLFELLKNENGSYHIKTKLKNNYIKRSGNLLEIYECTEYNPGDLEEESQKQPTIGTGNESNEEGSKDPIKLLPDFDYSYEFYFETINDNLFIENRTEYTEDGKFKTSTTDTNFNKTYYDIDTTTGLTNSITNAKNQVTNYRYDNKNRLISVSSGNKIVNYSYNQQNQIDKITNGTKEYKFIYDEFLNPKQIKLGDNITLVTNDYEENNGNLISCTYGNNQTVNYSYDEFDRIKTINRMNDTYNYKYDNNSNLVKIISNNDTIRYTYDLAKRLSEYKFNDFKIKYTYDSNDNIVDTKYNLDNKEYNVVNVLNDDDAIIKTIFGSDEIEYTYDSLGRLNGSSINSEFNTNYKYVTNGNRTSELVKSIKIGDDLYSYKYDKLNNITHIYNNNNLQNKYYYDEYNQLIKEENYETNQIINYMYDNFGNILSRKIYNLQNNNFISEDIYEYNNSDWEDQLTKFNNQVITYDQIGNPITIGENIELSWINGRQLNYYNDLNNSIQYKYNKDGIRISKTLNNIETKYYVEGSKIILEKTDNYMLYFIYNNIDDLIGFKYNDTLYYYLKNLHNDIIGIMDENYNVIARYSYDSWGDIISIKDGAGNDISNNNSHIANINPFRYRSYYYDKETELYYLNSRYYNPKWKRFISADTGIAYSGEINGYNMYNYSFNNPVNYIDSNGNLPKWLKKALKVAAIAVATVVVVSAVIAAAPAVANLAYTTALYYGASIAVAETAALVATTSCAVVATSVAVTGVNRVTEVVTGTNYGAKVMGEENYEKFETATNVAATTIVSIPQYVYEPYDTYPKTGAEPQNLREQIALRAVQSNPRGEIAIDSLGDPRMPGWLGWQKFKQYVNGIEVHYDANKYFPFYFDFKIKHW